MGDKTAVEEGRVSACPNHPQEPATVRCDSCLRPVCEACLVHDGASKYCSAKCHHGARVSRERIDDLNNRPPPSGTLPVVSMLLGALVVFGAIYAWQHWPALVKLYHHYVR
jgi:hypothetical protein